VGGEQNPEVKNKEGYKILAQNLCSWGTCSTKAKVKGATPNRWELITENELDRGWRGAKGNYMWQGVQNLGSITREIFLNSRVIC
jgi:hypothetical protein